MRNILVTIVGVFALIGTLIGCDRIQRVVIPEKGVDPASVNTIKNGRKQFYKQIDP